MRSLAEALAVGTGWAAAIKPGHSRHYTLCDQLQGQLRRSNAFEQRPYRAVIEL